MALKTVTFNFETINKVRIRFDPKMVFTPSVFSRLLANNLIIKDQDIALDLCCGSGLLAIVAAKMGARKVFAVDINPHAVYTTSKNARLNDVGNKVIAIEGHLYQPLGNRKFHLIFSNPPQTPIFSHLEDRLDCIGRAIFAGLDGRKVIDEIIDNARNYLAYNPDGTQTGKLQLVTTSIIDFDNTVNRLKMNGFDCNIVATKRHLFRKEYYMVLPLINANLFVQDGGKFFETIYVTCSHMVELVSN